MARRIALLLTTLLVSLAWARTASAEVPWARSLSTKQEEAFLDTSLESLELDEGMRDKAMLAARAGMLMFYGSCQSSGTITDGITADWFGEVESIATVELANLSDDYIWLIEIGISSAPAYEALAEIANEGESGAWAGNLPFLPPHSAASLRMGCNDLVVSGIGSQGQSMDALSIDSQSGPLTPRIASSMADTQVRFGRARGGRLVATSPGSMSLAAAALPLLEDRAAARELAETLYDGTELALGLPPLLGEAELEAAHGIVDMLLARDLSPEELAGVLEDAVPHRSERNDEALARLAAEVCARVEPLDRRALFLATIGRKGRLWQKAFIPACVLEEGDSLHVIDTLLESEDGRYLANDEALAQFIELAADPSFEAALPTLLGAREVGTPIPGEAFDIEIEGQEDEVPDEDDPSEAPPTEGEPEAEAEEPEPVDGGERPSVLWRALAWPPESKSRQAALEALIRPEDVAVVLRELVPTQMTSERLALFDRVAAKVDTIAEAQRSAALIPVMEAGVDSPYLEPELTRRLFTLSDRDHATLRPIMMRALAKNQEPFTLDALATLNHDYEHLLELFGGPLDGCSVNLATLETCLDTIEGDAELLAAAQAGGLDPEFLADVSRTLIKVDPDARQQGLLDRALVFGVSADPAVEAVCTRYEELADFDLDNEAHQAFLTKYGAEHECAQALLGPLPKRWLMIGGGLLGVLVLGGIVWVVRRQQMSALIDEA